MTDQSSEDPRRQLPSIDRLLAQEPLVELAGLYGRPVVRVQAQQALDDLRRVLPELATGDAAIAVSGLADAIQQRLEGGVGRQLSRVINATGVFLHTNLGRAPLPRAVLEQLPPALDAASDLEMDLESGRRAERNARVAQLLAALTGAPAALAANNNAAALVLALSTLAVGREVVVSRGELVEIGGSFRIPEILSAAGARLREVGTTNRTRIDDYRQAIGDHTALLLKVFPSNYRISGFVAEVAAAELASLAAEHDLPLLVDEGSGHLRPNERPQLADHPSVAELLEAGAALVASSGDKLLGGPQAGLLMGDAALVRRCRRHPLYRALRPGRMVYASLEAVLRERLAERSMPIDRLWSAPDELRPRLAALATRLGASIEPAVAFVGGGAAPERPIAGEALAIEDNGELARALRLGRPPVVGYLSEGWLVLDLRTVDPADDDALATAVEDARQDGVGGRGAVV